MKLHIRPIRCDHMQMLHTAMIRDYDACTAAQGSTSASVRDVSWQASTRVARWVKSAAAPPWVRWVRRLRADIIWNLCIIWAVRVFHCSFPENLQIWFGLIVVLTGGSDWSRKSDVTNAFLLTKHTNFLNSTHGREDYSKILLFVCHIHTSCWSLSLCFASHDFINSALLFYLTLPMLSMLPFPPFRQAAARPRQ